MLPPLIWDFRPKGQSGLCWLQSKSGTLKLICWSTGWAQHQLAPADICCKRTLLAPLLLCPVGTQSWNRTSRLLWNSLHLLCTVLTTLLRTHTSHPSTSRFPPLLFSGTYLAISLQLTLFPNWIASQLHSTCSGLQQPMLCQPISNIWILKIPMVAIITPTRCSSSCIRG